MPEPRSADILPCIRRARGFRLYDAGGRRYLDLHRPGALLGHRFGVTVMKSSLSQGLAASVPTAWEGRLAAAVGRLVPSHPVVRLFASPEAALAAAGRFLGTRLSWGELPDPALGGAAGDAGGAGGSSPAAALWRPFLPAPAGARVLLAVLPLSVAGCPSAACFPAGASREAPASETLPAFLCAAAVQACAALDPAAGREPDGRTPGFAADPVVERAIDGAPLGWARSGPYVRAVFPEAEYARVRAAFLRAGVLLHPGHPGPSVLPGECSPGESRLLADLFAGTPGG
jgi:hypothetical protein